MFELFCTFGLGCANTVKREIYQKLNCSEVREIDRGKFIFSCPATVLKNLSTLKSIERLFFLVKFEPSISLKYKGDFYNLMKLMEGLDNWDVMERSVREIQNGSITDELDRSSPAKRQRLEDDFSNTTFRVSCRCRQKSAMIFDTQRMARTISTIIQRKTKWKADMRQPDLEVVFHINNEGTVIGIPIFTKPLSARSYLKHHGLRSTTAYVLAELASIKAEDVILDPMCGKGIVLIEAAKEFPSAVYYGCDISETTIAKCQENMAFAQEGQKINILQSDIKKLPFKDGRFDKVICDMPFGKKHSSIDQVKQECPQWIASINRVVKSGGLVVLLTSSVLCDWVKECVLGDQVKNIDSSHQETQPTASVTEPQTRSSEQDNAESTVITENVRIETQTVGNCEQYDKTDIEETDATIPNHKETSLIEGNSNIGLYSPCEKVLWELDSEHYLSLGETRSNALVFKKL